MYVILCAPQSIVSEDTCLPLIITTFNFFYQSIIPLQCFVSFCYTTNEVNQLYVYLYPLSLGPLSHHPPIPPIQVTTEHRAELPVLYSMFLLAIYFMHGSVYMSILISQFIPPSPSLPCPHVHSLHLCLYSCPANRFICTIFLDSTYMH